MSFRNITGNSISAAPDGSEVILDTSPHASIPDAPATYTRFILASGIVQNVTSKWTGRISSVSWSGRGDKLAFLWSGGVPIHTDHLGRDVVNALDFGIRLSDASATDLPAASSLVASLKTALGDISCPVLSASGMDVYAVAKTNSSKTSGLRPRVRLLRFPLGPGKPDVVADDIEVAGTGEFVSLCRDTDDNAVMLFERHRVSRLELATGIHNELIGAESQMVIASAAW